MAGDLIIDKVAKTSVATRVSLVDSLVKCWSNLDGDAGTVVSRAGLNTASITDNGTGDYSLNMTAAFANINFSGTGMRQNMVGNNNYGVTDAFGTRTVSAFRIVTHEAGVAADTNSLNIMMTGDLA